MNRDRIRKQILANLRSNSPRRDEERKTARPARRPRTVTLYV